MTRKNQILIQQYIDGDLPEEKIKDIQHLIDKNSDAKKYYEEMKQVNDAIAGSVDKDIKVDLKDKIMNRIQGSETKNVYTVKTSNQTRAIFPNRHWNVAYAFILGIVIGALIVTFMPGEEGVDDIPESQISGSVSGNASGDIFSIPVDLPGVDLNIRADKLKENFYKIVIELFTEDQGMLNLSFNKSGFYLQSIQMLKQNPDCRITTNRSNVQMYNRGDNVYVLLIKKLSYLPEEMNIQVFLDETIKYENTVTIK
jgi:hypothetical protein